MIDGDIIADIYEAAALPERWPVMLGRIAQRFDAIGGNLIHSGEGGIVVRSSPEIAPMSEEFERRGLNENNTRVSRLIERQPYPGFLTDSDMHSAEELETLPLYRFLNEHNGAAGAGTMVQGASNDALIIAIEGFPDHAASRAARPVLDMLRPHLARSAVLGAQVEAQHRRAAVLALEAMRVPAAMLDGAGRVREANPSFVAALGPRLQDGRKRLRLTDPVGDRALSSALDRLRMASLGASVPLRDDSGPGLAVLHLLPLAGEARDLFSGITTVAIVADAANRRTPGADLLQALFDLTPSEASVARQLAAGRQPRLIAQDGGNSVATVRSHLKSIFLKTGTNRQVELSALLRALVSPAD